MLHLFLTGGLLFCFCTGLVFLYFHPPGSTRFLPPCLFYRLTGLYCAGCGSTRALYTALHGDFAGALRCNLLLFPLLLPSGTTGIGALNSLGVSPEGDSEPSTVSERL